MSSFYATDYPRNFDVALILGSLDAPMIWEANQWRQLVNALAPIVSASRGPAKSEYCYFRPSGSKRKLLEFRCKTWGEYPVFDGIFSSWHLHSPPDSVCVRKKRCPDFYVSISNRREVSRTDIRFGPVITLALASDISGGSVILDQAVDDIGKITSALVIAKKLRPWGFETETGYNNGISETSWFHTGLAGRDASEEILYEHWDKLVVRH